MFLKQGWKDSLVGNVQRQGPEFNNQNPYFKKPGVVVHVLLILTLHGGDRQIPDIQRLFRIQFLVSSWPVSDPVSKNLDGQHLRLSSGLHRYVHVQTYIYTCTHKHTKTSRLVNTITLTKLESIILYEMFRIENHIHSEIRLVSSSSQICEKMNHCMSWFWRG